jgi:PIN domain nuclease of toxin-antitoxin system
MILDSSAVLAALFSEPGADQVMRHLGAAAISVVNYSEVLSKMIERGESPEQAIATVKAMSLDIVPMSEPLAAAAAQLTLAGKKAGLSLGDRICLALALERDDEVLTSDRAWAAVAHGAKVTYIR